MKTYLFWANIRTFSNHGSGPQPAGFMQVQVRAPNPYQASQMFEGQYGRENVMSIASQVPNSEQEGW